MAANLPGNWDTLFEKIAKKLRDLDGYVSATTPRTGTAVLAAGAVTVTLASTTARTLIQLTVQAPGGTVGAVHVFSRIAGTSFTIHSTSGTDTSTVGWSAIEPR